LRAPHQVAPGPCRTPLVRSFFTTAPEYPKSVASPDRLRGSSHLCSAESAAGQGPACVGGAVTAPLMCSVPLAAPDCPARIAVVHSISVGGSCSIIVPRRIMMGRGLRQHDGGRFCCSFSNSAAPTQSLLLAASPRSANSGPRIPRWCPGPVVRGDGAGQIRRGRRGPQLGARH
jgi:hypothetical protein